jgi:DNA-binding PadR family transcriptional regulator
MRNLVGKRLAAASLKPIMLSLLSRGDMYGYELIEAAKTLSGGRIVWTSNKLYPLLHSMESDGLLSSYWRPSDSGPDRKYYRLAPKGRKAIEAARADWSVVLGVLCELWGPEFKPAVGG